MTFHPRLILVPLALLAIALVTFAAVHSGGSGNGRGAPAVAHPAWPAPALHDPTVVEITDHNTNVRLDPARDYVLRLPKGRPVLAPHGLTIAGGHNVVLVGGSVNVPDRSGAALLEGQTGTIHIEGVRLTGPQLMEGFDLSESSGATVELENIYVDTVHGSYATNHADLLQTWAGPRRLLVDGFYGSTDYQGFFLLPNQHYSGPPPELFDLRHIYIDDRHGGYVLWRQPTPAFPVHVQDVVVTPNRQRDSRDWWFWPKPSTGDQTWSAVRLGMPQPAISEQVQTAGVSYR